MSKAFTNQAKVWCATTTTRVTSISLRGDSRASFSASLWLLSVWATRVRSSPEQRSARRASNSTQLLLCIHWTHSFDLRSGSLCHGEEIYDHGMLDPSKPDTATGATCICRSVMSRMAQEAAGFLPLYHMLLALQR